MIRTKLTLWNCLVLALVLTAVGFAIYFTTEESLYASVDEGLRNRANFMMNDPFGPGRNRRPGEMEGRAGPGPEPGPRNDRGEPIDAGGRKIFGIAGSQGNGQGNGQGGPGAPPPEMGEGPVTKYFRQGGPKFDFNMTREAMREQGIDPKLFEDLRVQAMALRPMVLRLDGQGMDPGDTPWNVESFAAAKTGKVSLDNVRIMDRPFRIITLPLRRDGKIDAIAQVAYPLSGVQKELKRLEGTLLIVFPVAIVVMLAAGVALTRRALHPITEIASAAERIEATNLSGRLDVPGNDEFGHLSDTFNTMLARLEATFKDKDEAYARLRQFTADASHELKTPLTAIRVRTGLALRRGEIEPEKYRHHLEAIDRAALLMTSIVQDLLFLAKSDEGRLDLTIATTSAQEIVEDAVASVDTSKHQVSLEVASGLMVEGDRSALTRVLVNLLENSVRHTPEKGRIFLEAIHHEGGARFTVRDEGEGIPAEHVPLVFDRFHRVDMARDRQAGGTGLGLAIAKAIVDAHGGQIRIASEVEKGTTVTMDLSERSVA